MSEPTIDPIHLWRAAVLLRCELKHGEVENEVQVKSSPDFVYCFSGAAPETLTKHVASIARWIASCRLPVGGCRGGGSSNGRA